MSTEIKSKYDAVLRIGTDSLTPTDVREGWVNVSVRAKLGPPNIMVKRADLLRAVEAECNVIIIDRADHAAVDGSSADAIVRHGGGIVGRNPLTTEQVERTRAHAEALLLATYRVETVPPVDEKQVEALARDLAAAEVPGDTRWIARRLVERGVRVEVTP